MSKIWPFRVGLWGKTSKAMLKCTVAVLLEDVFNVVSCFPICTPRYFSRGRTPWGLLGHRQHPIEVAKTGANYERMTFFALFYIFVSGFLKLNFQESLKEVCQELATEIGILCKWGTLGSHLLGFSFFNYFDKTATIYTIVGCIFPLPRFCRFFLAAIVMANFLSSNLKFIYFSKSIFV